MKKYQARKVLSVLLSVLMILTSVYAGLSVFAYAAEPVDLPDANTSTATALTNGKIYKVTEHTTITGGTNGLSVPANAKVFIDIAAGVTLTVKGGNANGSTAGKAGILMNAGSKLYITGGGTLSVTGGNGGNGGNGGVNTGSTGGAGGAGGAGGGAGIGTNGGAGGNANGGDGNSADEWPTGNNAATVTIAQSVIFPGGTDGSNGSKGGSVNVNGSGNTVGGTGGGGGAGTGGFAIGAGGYGGGGGGQGGNGGNTGGCNGSDYKGKGGGGGNGAVNGDAGKGRTGNDENGNGGSGGAKGTAGTSYTPIITDPFAAMRTAINDNADYYGKEMPALVAIEVATLTDVKSALETPYNNLFANSNATFNKDVYNYYFADYDTAAMIQLLEEAIAMQENIALAQWLQTESAETVDYDAGYAALNTIWTEFNTKYETYKAKSDDTRAFLENANYIVPAEVEAKLAEFKFAMDVANLHENYYDLITGNVATFGAYDSDWVAETNNAGDALSAAMVTIDSYRTTLNGLDQAAVTKVFGAGYVESTLTPLYNQLGELTTYIEYKDRFAAYKSVYDTALAPVDLAASDETLYNVLTARDAWYTDLQNYVAELREFDADFAEKVLGDLYGVMQSKIDSIYATLNARVTAQIDTTYDYYMGFVAQYGYTINTSDQVNVTNYNALKNIFSNLKSAHYNFLVETDNFAVPEATVAKYEAIKKALLAFENYDKTKGLSAYEFNNEPVENITRAVSEYDQVRNLSYVVDADKRETAYDNAKTLLDSDLVKGLLAGDGEEGGFSLDSLSDTVKDVIFSDTIVNFLMSFVYPYIIQYFAPIWADLPETYPYHVEQSALFTTLKFDFNFPIAANLKSLRTALNELGLYALPNQLGAMEALNAYPEIQAMLNQVTSDPVYNKQTEEMTVNPWADERLPHDEKGNLAFEWGVHDKDSLINALSASLAGVSPLILALLSDVTYTKSGVNLRDPNKTISASARDTITIVATIQEVNLTMKFAGNAGFNNALAPILSALGAENLENGNNKDLRGIATLIANGFDQVITKLSADPLDFLLKALPNLAFALDYGLVQPLLNELKTSITYWADVHATTDCDMKPTADADDALKTKDTPIDINVGELLLGGMDLDFSSASGLISALVGMIGGDEEEPEPGTEPTEPAEPTGIAALLAALPVDELFRHLAFWGDSVSWKTGYRTVSPYTLEGHTKDFPYINSTPSEVFANLVNYLLDTIAGDRDLLATLVGALGLEVDLTDEESLVTAILNNVLDHPDDAIAAIVELMVPATYDNWATVKAPTDTTFTYDDEEITAAHVAYLKYANNWTKDGASAIANNVDELIPSITNLLGKDVSINAMLQEALSGLYTGETLTTINNALAGAMAGLVSTDAEGEGEGEAADGGLDILGLLKDELGIDFAAFEEVGEDYDWGVTDGDRAAFVKALCGILDPLSPLLKLFAPGKDISILDGVFNIKGYDVYPKSIGLLFDVLGVAKVTGYEDKSTSEELEMIVNALFDRIDALTAEGNSMIGEILTLIPELIYFVESNGLSVAIRNLIYPIQVVLDTIYPIYPTDLVGLLKELVIGDSEEEPTGFAAVLQDLDLNDLRMTSVLKIVDTVLGTELSRSPLATYAIPALTITHGNIDKADVLTILLCGVIEGLEWEIIDGDNAGKTNGDVLFAAIGNEDIAKTYSKLVPILTGEASAIDESKITPINWAYMYGDDYVIELADFAMPEYSNAAVLNYLATYENNQWTADLAQYLDENLDDLVKDVLKVAGQDEDMLSTLLSGLINDKLYTADVVNAAGNAIYGLLGKLEERLKTVIDGLLGTEIAGKTYTPVASVSDKADFIAKMKDILRPFTRLLGFVLFGENYKFFNGTTKEDLITLPGGDAYDATLVPVLEALGVNMPTKDTFDDTEDAIDKVLTAVTDRLDEIAADPINELLNLLPNLLYFLNADGIKAVINNAVLPFDGLVEAVTGDSAATLLAGVEVSGVALNDLNTENLLGLIEGLADIQIPAGVKSAVGSFYIGKAKFFESANGKPAFKLIYDGDRKDMLTILASVLIEVLAYEDNAKILKGISEEAYTVVTNLLNMKEVAMRQIDWLFPEYANTDKTFSGMNTTVIFEKTYGPLFTREKAAYIADNIDDFVDDMIQLLGITSQKHTLEDGKEEFITSLDQLLDEYVGESIYTKANLDKILGYLKDALDKIDTLGAEQGVDLGGRIKDILWRSLRKNASDNVTGNLNYYKDYEVASFADGDRAAFTNEIIRMLDPLFPLLKWLLCDDDIAFLMDSTGKDQVVLLGAEGYRYGLGPILEALFCKNIPTQDALNATTTTDALLRPVLDAVFNRLDDIFENPADEIFAILPNLAYFINSKGLDTSFKNLLNAVCTLFEAIRPILPADMKDQDFYAMIYDLLNLKALGLENGLETIDMQWIFNKVVGMIDEGSSQDLDTFLFDAVAEMTTGKLVSYNSMTGFDAYRMVQTEASKADTITIILRFALQFLATNDNAAKLKQIVREKVELSEDGYKYTDMLIDLAVSYTNNDLGMDSILHVIYYLFYGLHHGAGATADWLTSYNAKFEYVDGTVRQLSKRDNSLLAIATFLDDLYKGFIDEDGTTGNVMGDSGFASHGFLSFFRQIIEWIRNIFAKIKNVF